MNKSRHGGEGQFRHRWKPTARSGRLCSPARENDALFPLTRERRLGLTCGLRPTFTPRQESRGAEREPAERTLVGCLLSTRPLPRRDRFPGVGVSVGHHFKTIALTAARTAKASAGTCVHLDPCPPILSTRAIIKPKTDVAGPPGRSPLAGLGIDAGGPYRHETVALWKSCIRMNKVTRRYVLAETQFRNIKNVTIRPAERSRNDSLYIKDGLLT